MKEATTAEELRAALEYNFNQIELSKLTGALRQMAEWNRSETSDFQVVRDLINYLFLGDGLTKISFQTEAVIHFFTVLFPNYV